MSDKAEPKIVDYSAMPDLQLLQTLGDDASQWAAAFCQIAKRHGHNLDEGWMIGWFANAIEHSTQVRQDRMFRQTQPVLTKPMNLP